ncbi:MAG: hypothetical protein ACHQNT_09820 [Bacteroidia bacterium]
MSIENLIVIILVVAAAVFIGKRIYNTVQHNGTHAGCAKCDDIKNKK